MKYLFIILCFLFIGACQDKALKNTQAGDASGDAVYGRAVYGLSIYKEK